MQFRPGPPMHPVQAFARPPFTPGSMAMPPGAIPPHLMRPPMMIPAGPVVLTPPGSTPTPAPALKSTTLYVGKIASTVSDEVIQTLLEACGTVKSWKPMQDPATNKSKGFGFCEFETAEGVLRALRLLNNLSLDGQELLLKCNTATQRYIDEYQANKQKDAGSKEQAAKQENGASDSESRDEDNKTDTQEDDAILVKIMALVSDRAAKQRSQHNAEQAADLLNEVLPPPPSKDRSKSRSQPSATKEHTHSSRERERDRGTSADRDAERQFERERQRQKREQELRQADQERVYQKKLKEWEHVERAREKAADKERSDRKAVEKDRARLIRADNEVGDDDEEEEPWARKPLRLSDSRRRKRKEEVRDDAGDKEAEGAERAAARQKRQQQAQADAEAAEQAVKTASDQSPTNGFAEEETVDPNDPIYQAMMAAAQAPPQSTSPLDTHPSPSRDIRADKPSPNGTATQRSAAAPALKPGWHSVFGGDEDQDAPQRRLIPLNYSEEEQKAAQAAAAAAASAAAPAAGAVNEEELEKLKKQIPRSMQALQATPINWDAFDAGQPQIEQKLGKWVSGQIEKLLGQQEESLLNFVRDELKKHAAPADLLKQLDPIFDLEAEDFVLKLYQIVVFESSKFAAFGQV